MTARGFPVYIERRAAISPWIQLSRNCTRTAFDTSRSGKWIFAHRRGNGPLIFFKQLRVRDLRIFALPTTQSTHNALFGIFNGDKRSKQLSHLSTKNKQIRMWTYQWTRHFLTRFKRRGNKITNSNRISFDNGPTLNGQFKKCPCAKW